MLKSQKIGLVMLPVISILNGLVFLVAGFMANSASLKMMGAILLPLGLAGLLVVLWALGKAG